MRLRRTCLLAGRGCSDDGYALPGSSRCRAHGGRKGDPRSTTARGYGADHQDSRRQVMARAGASRYGIGGRCEACGLPGTLENPLEAAHVLAHALGGENHIANYMALHRRENRGEAALIVKKKRALERGKHA